MNSRLSIYVSSPDSYSDVFAIFYTAFKKYWNNCPYEFVFATNTQKYDGIRCLCNNKTGDTWVERTIAALPHICTKYILLMCDDLIITDYINNDEINKILDYMECNNIKYCRLKPLRFGKGIKELSSVCYVNKQTPYAVNLQIGIIRKDYFAELLGDGSISAWEIENVLNKQSSTSNEEYYKDIISVNRPIIPFVHGVWKGKWIRSSYTYIKMCYPDYSFERPILPFYTDLKIRAIDFIEKNVSFSTRRRIKSILMKLGMSFSTRN